MYLCVQMKVKARYIRIGAVALLTLFVAYYAILTLYAHVHEVNGTFIVHSHPFTEHHSHSSGQALTLHFLSTFTSVGSDSIESACPDLPLLCLLTLHFMPCLHLEMGFIYVHLPYIFSFD